MLTPEWRGTDAQDADKCQREMLKIVAVNTSYNEQG
jgi:hypothetical protein